MKDDCFSKENWLLVQALLPEQPDDALDIVRSAVMGLHNDLLQAYKSETDPNYKLALYHCRIWLEKKWFPVFFEEVDSGVDKK